MPTERVIAPLFSFRILRAANVVAYAKRTPGSAQEHDPRVGIPVGPMKCVEQCLLEVRTDGIQLVRTVYRNDTDAVIDFVEYERFCHDALAPPGLLRLEHRQFCSLD